MYICFFFKASQLGCRGEYPWVTNENDITLRTYVPYFPSEEGWFPKNHPDFLRGVDSQSRVTSVLGCKPIVLEKDTLVLD